MTIQLPVVPFSTTDVSFTSAAMDLKPYMGGPDQRAERYGGDRYSVDVSCRPMRFSQAAAFIVKLNKGLSEKVLWIIPQPDDFEGTSDTTATSGAGTTLNVAGGGTKHVGQYLSLVKDGVRYLHQIEAVSGNGLTILPGLKVAITGGEAVELVAPKIEGFLDGRTQKFTLGMIQNVGCSFRIVEAQ